MEKKIPYCSLELPETSLKGRIEEGPYFYRDEALPAETNEDLVWFKIKLDEDMPGTPHRKGNVIIARVHNLDIGHAFWKFYTKGMSVMSDSGHFDNDRDFFETDSLIIN